MTRAAWEEWPKEPWTVRKDEHGMSYIEDADGVDLTNHPGALARAVQCVNACKGIAFPENHIPAERNARQRVEELRKRAVADLERVRAEAAAA